MKNKFLMEMKSRGYLNQCTDLDKLEKFAINNRFLHILVLIAQQAVFMWEAYANYDFKTNAKHGHQPIVLLGGGTTLIGDPSGKDNTRKILEKKEIKKNIEKIKKIFKKILNTSNKKTKPIFVDNAKWLTELKYIKFLREIGIHFTINKMLTFDSVKLRLEREQSLSYMEFNYMILQAYDFYQLFKKIIVFYKLVDLTNGEI